MNPEPVRKYRTKTGLESRVEDIDNLKKKELVDRVYSLLEEYTDQNLPLTNSSVRVLYVEEIREFYRFLLEHPEKEGNKKRPSCPVANENNCGGRTTYPYKEKMLEYIAEWGFRFENPSYLVPCMLEATANYLESKHTRKGLRLVKKHS